MKPQSLRYGDTIGFIAPSYAHTKPHILLIEDHERFSSPAVLSKYFSHISQSGIMDSVTGLIFGHYSSQEIPQVDEILRRFAEKYGIPAVRCEDFGHGGNNAVFPIGIGATLDADNLTFSFAESGVSV